MKSANFRTLKQNYVTQISWLVVLVNHGTVCSV